MDEMTAPPIEGIAPWWPVIIASISGVSFVVSGLWAAYTAMSNQKSQREADQAKMEYDTRKDFVEDLVKDGQLNRDESHRLREALSSALFKSTEQSALVNQMILTIAELKEKLKANQEARELDAKQWEVERTAFKRDIDSMKAHISRLEKDNTEKICNTSTVTITETKTVDPGT